MPAPSFRVMMPFSCSSSSARASLVVSLGTRIFTPLSDFFPQAARLRTSTSAKASVAIFANTECFMMISP